MQKVADREVLGHGRLDRDTAEVQQLRFSWVVGSRCRVGEDMTGQCLVDRQDRGIGILSTEEGHPRRKSRSLTSLALSAQTGEDNCRRDATMTHTHLSGGDHIEQLLRTQGLAAVPDLSLGGGGRLELLGQQAVLIHRQLLAPT